MEPSSLKDFTQQNFYIIMLVQVVIGLVLGLIPLLLSFRRGKKNLGMIALVASLLLSLISPILSLVAVVVFIVLILRNPAAA
jgi:hypothetical protein